MCKVSAFMNGALSLVFRLIRWYYLLITVGWLRNEIKPCCLFKRTDFSIFTREDIPSQFSPRVELIVNQLVIFFWNVLPEAHYHVSLAKDRLFRKTSMLKREFSYFL